MRRRIAACRRHRTQSLETFIIITTKTQASLAWLRLNLISSICDDKHLYDD